MSGRVGPDFREGGEFVSRRLKSDKMLFIAALLLVCLSVVMVYSASALVAQELFEQPYMFLFRQGTWAVLGRREHR